MLLSLLTACLISIGCVVFSVILFYEMHYRGWRWLDTRLHQPRLSMLAAVMITFAFHTLMVWGYGGLFYLLVEGFGFGGLRGAVEDDGALSYVYFSAATYSTLGFGDVYASGPLRLLIGVEAINGLLLIGWSVTFTYFRADALFRRERQG